MKRSRVTLDDIAALDNLSWAFWRAARGKRFRTDVQRFAAQLDRQLAALQHDILNLTVQVGCYETFRIHDPKPRLIHAPCFRERVLHHAMMRHLGPVLDRALVDDTFACREGKGAHAAALRAQHHLRRFPWHVKMDMRTYFASIDHDVLFAALHRRFRDPGVLTLCAKILRGHTAEPGRPGKGLPIGALTSQHFANLYLAPLDRYLLETLRVPGMTRYMDDVACYCSSRVEAKHVLAQAEAFLQSELRLQLRDPGRIQRSDQGLSFVGFRIFPGTLRLSRRRLTRYRQCRKHWEHAYLDGRISELTLQAGYAAALAITAHADSRAVRKAGLHRRPAPDA